MSYEHLAAKLKLLPHHWCVTGAAGFIGSHLVQRLLQLDQHVVGLDNFATGRRTNLEDVKSSLTTEQWRRFRLIEGDICDLPICHDACRGAQFVLHQAALGSVPRSIADPLRSHAVNVDGFLNMLTAGRDARVRRFVYASSSSVYGDHPALPKIEDQTGRPLSPYAVTKVTNELYAGVFARAYGLPTTGLRYFNVFGPRQDPAGAYAAVIPKWFAALAAGDVVRIHGDGQTSRDFCFVENVVQANLLAALADSPDGSPPGSGSAADAQTTSAATARVYNIACGDRTTLLEVFGQIRRLVAEGRPEASKQEPVFGPERAGDVRHSLADITRARQELGYQPVVSVTEGLRKTFEGTFAVRR